MYVMCRAHQNWNRASFKSFLFTGKICQNRQPSAIKHSHICMPHWARFIGAPICKTAAGCSDACYTVVEIAFKWPVVVTRAQVIQLLSLCLYESPISTVGWSAVYLTSRETFLVF